MVVEPGTIITAVKLAIATCQEVQRRYQVFVAANEDQKVLSHRLTACLFVLDAFDGFVRDSIRSVPSRLRPDIVYCLDHVQSVFEKFYFLDLKLPFTHNKYI